MVRLAVRPARRLGLGLHVTRRGAGCLTTLCRLGFRLVLLDGDGMLARGQRFLDTRVVLNQVHAKSVKRTNRIVLVSQRVHDDKVLVFVVFGIHNASREVPDGTKPSDW